MLISTFIGSVLVVCLVPIKVHTSKQNKRDGDMAPSKYSPIAIGEGEENIYK